MSQFVGGPSKQIRDGRLSNIYVDTVFANSIQAASGAGTPARQSGTFTVYIAAAGDDTNDGLTISTPVLTFARALAIFKGVSYDEFVLSIANDFVTFDPTVALANEIQIDTNSGNNLTRAIDLTCISGHCQTFRFLGNPDTYDYTDANYTKADYDIATLYGDSSASVSVPSDYFKKYTVASTSVANNPRFALHNGLYSPILSTKTTATDFYLVTDRDDNTGTISLYGGSTTTMTSFSRSGGARVALIASCNVIFERLAFEDISEDLLSIQLRLTIAPAVYYYGCVCDSFTIVSSGTICYYFGSRIDYPAILQNIENVEFHECYFQYGLTATNTSAYISKSVLNRGILANLSHVYLKDFCVLIYEASTYPINANGSNIFQTGNLLCIGAGAETFLLDNTNVTLLGDVECKGPISSDGSNIKSKGVFTIISTLQAAITLSNGSQCILLSTVSMSSTLTAILLQSGSKFIASSGLVNSGAGANVYQRGSATASTTFTADDADTGVVNTQGTMTLLLR